MFVSPNASIPASVSLESTWASSPGCGAPAGNSQGRPRPGRSLSLRGGQTPSLLLFFGVHPSLVSQRWFAVRAPRSLWGPRPLPGIPMPLPVPDPAPSDPWKHPSLSHKLSSTFKRTFANVFLALQDSRSWTDFRLFIHHISGTRELS